MAYNKIILGGKQTCNYLCVQKNAPTEDEFTYINDEPTEWNDDTILLANFNDEEHRLIAGNSEIIGSIEGYEIYRKKYNESHSEYIGTVKSGAQNKVNDFVVDYTVRNGVEYSYYFYPRLDKTQSGTALSPLVTKQVAINCPYWSLFIVDETEEENVFYLDKMFKFELNLSVDDMTNNAQINITQNFTKYPTLQYGASNYWSGSLSALCGFIASNCVDYVQTVNMINELKSISSDRRRKFLKDIDGNLWEVDISSPINISSENIATKTLKTWKFSWVEVGDASKISIINNPNRPTTEWILTENGNAVPYITYTWGDQYIWDDSYIWTANDDIYATESSNLGRNMTKQKER